MYEDKLSFLGKSKALLYAPFFRTVYSCLLITGSTNFVHKSSSLVPCEGRNRQRGDPLALEEPPLGSRSVDAAAVALLVLKGVAGQFDSSTEAVYFWNSGPTRLHQSDVVERLRSMVKPTRCSVQAWGTDMMISCAPLGTDGEREQQRRIADGLIRHWSDVATQYATGKPSDPLILLKGGADSLVVPFSIWRIFLRDYFVLHTAVSREIGRSAARQGVVYALEVLPATPPEDLLPFVDSTSE